MTKKLAAVAVSLILSAGIAAVAFASSSFSDVPEDHPDAAAIRVAADRGYFAGYGDGTFGPDHDITAAQLARVVGRIYPDGITRGRASVFAVAGADAVKAAAGGERTVEERLASIELRLLALELASPPSSTPGAGLRSRYYHSPVYAGFGIWRWDFGDQQVIASLVADVNRELGKIQTAINGY